LEVNFTIGVTVLRLRVAAVWTASHPIKFRSQSASSSEERSGRTAHRKREGGVMSDGCRQRQRLLPRCEAAPLVDPSGGRAAGGAPTIRPATGSSPGSPPISRGSTSSRRPSCCRSWTRATPPPRSSTKRNASGSSGNQLRSLQSPSACDVRRHHDHELAGHSHLSVGPVTFHLAGTSSTKLPAGPRRTLGGG